MLIFTSCGESDLGHYTSMGESCLCAIYAYDTNNRKLWLLDRQGGIYRQIIDLKIGVLFNKSINYLRSNVS